MSWHVPRRSVKMLVDENVWWRMVVSYKYEEEAGLLVSRLEVLWLRLSMDQVIPPAVLLCSRRAV